MPFSSLKHLLAFGCVVLICTTTGQATTAKNVAGEERSQPQASKRKQTAESQTQTPANSVLPSSKLRAGSVSRPKSHATHSVTSRSKGGKRRSSATSRRRGQQAIDSDRAREIQQALIREKYLEGEATGTWDERTAAAMTRFQSDNGWQTKVVPDSRALIKLGLGPKHANLINPGGSINPALLPENARDSHPGGARPDE